MIIIALVLTLLFVVGIILGTKSSIVTQGILFLLYILFMNTSIVENMGLLFIMPVLLGYSFFIGVIIGNISYIIQTKSYKNIRFSNPFKVKDI